MSRNTVCLLGLSALLGLFLVACGDAKDKAAKSPGESAPVEKNTAPDEGAAAAEVTPPAASGEAPPAAENPELAKLKAEIDDVQKKIDEYTATLDGIGDVSALKSKISTLRASSAALMGDTLDRAKQEIAKLEQKVAAYDDALGVRKALTEKLDKLKAEIKQLGGE